MFFFPINYYNKKHITIIYREIFMSKKYLAFFKTIGRYWFLVLVIIIIIIALYNPVIAIWITVFTIILFLISFLPTGFFKKKFMKLLKKYYRIEDVSIAQELNRTIREIREIMFDLTQNQQKKPWLIVFLNKRYIFYHQKTVEELVKLYKEGHDDKEILQNLKEYDIKSIDEVKKIKEILIKLNRFSNGEIQAI